MQLLCACLFPMHMTSRTLSPDTHAVLSSLRDHKPVLPHLAHVLQPDPDHHYTFYPQVTPVGILKHTSLFTLELGWSLLCWTPLG